jgi:hypothetical protein
MKSVFWRHKLISTLCHTLINKSFKFQFQFFLIFKMLQNPK